MRKINENEFVRYTLVARGYSVTMFNLQYMLKQFGDNPGPATLYGYRRDGTEAIIDSK